jgi:hypothetical protein
MLLAKKQQKSRKNYAQILLRAYCRAFCVTLKVNRI